MTRPDIGSEWATRSGKHEGVGVIVEAVTDKNVKVKFHGSGGARWSAAKANAYGPRTMTLTEFHARFVPRKALVTDERGNGHAYRRKAFPKDKPPMPARTAPAVQSGIIDPKSSQLNITVEVVTPLTAAAWLASGGINRRVSSARVSQYATAMRRGEWTLTGEAIKLAADGTLRDGQQRLSAVVECGIPLTTVVIRNVPADAFDRMDSGKVRTRSDVLGMHGFPSALPLAACVRGLIWIGQTGRLRPGRGNEPLVTNASSLAYAHEHPEVIEAVRLGDRVYHSGMVGGIGLWSIAFGLFLRLSEHDAHEFAEAIITGENLMRGDPRLLIRNRAGTRNRGEFASESGRESLLALIIKAWNMWRKGKTAKALTWHGYAENPEPFPVAV